MLDPEYTQTLKIVSRVKHRILANYLAPWGSILGSSHKALGYIDCFAGGGIYKDETGTFLQGSPAIALQLAKSYVLAHPGHKRLLEFVEASRESAELLRAVLALEEPLPQSVTYNVKEEDAQRSIDDLIAFVRSSGARSRIIPTFFFVDPYGHPILCLRFAKSCLWDRPRSLLT